MTKSTMARILTQLTGTTISEDDMSFNEMEAKLEQLSNIEQDEDTEIVEHPDQPADEVLKLKVLHWLGLHTKVRASTVKNLVVTKRGELYTHLYVEPEYYRENYERMTNFIGEVVRLVNMTKNQAWIDNPQARGERGIAVVVIKKVK